MKNIVLISGSPRKNSISFRIATNLMDRLEKKETLTIEMIDMRESFLPPIQKIWQSMEDVPAENKTMYKIMDEADGFIIVSANTTGAILQ